MRTGCFVKMCPVKKFINFLTIFFIMFISLENFSDAQSILDQEKASTYLRWNLFTGRDQLQFDKKGNKVTIRTLNSGVYASIKGELSQLKTDATYIKNVSYFDQDPVLANVSTIEVELVNDNVEMFSFYRERDKKYVLDFWVDGDSVSLKKAALKKAPASVATASNVEDSAKEKSVDVVKEAPVTAKESKEAKAEVLKEEAASREGKEFKDIKIEKVSLKPRKKLSTKVDKDTLIDEKNEKLAQTVKDDSVLSNIVVDPNKLEAKSELELQTEESDSKKPYRDFRYGSTFIWDYDPIIPAYKQIVDLKTKLPEVFFPIANRNFKKDEKEAHLQLTINLYRKKKWGLMYKSIKLFQEKYGVNAEGELIEYIKANSILRENIDSTNPELFKNGITMLIKLSEKSESYEFRKALYKYLLAYHYQNGDLLRMLQMAKNYFAETRNNFDFEESIVPAEVMLNTLAKLGQLDQIRELSQEKTIKKIVPAQLLFAYQSYSLLRAGDIDGVISLYEKNKASLAKPIDPVMMYNTAEAYFRSGKYVEAMNMYQEFVKNYSHEFVASNANLRIALCSDLLDRNYNETLELYKRSIDQSIDSSISYESRIRYVAFRSVRKYVLDDRDKEIRIFLEQDKNSKTSIDKNITKLLHQVRLRTLIVDEKYKDALAYLSLIPTISMMRVDARVFEADGAEIIHGYIGELYKNAEYSQVIKAWQIYKDKYVDKVAQDAMINFLVGSSYIKLGLYKGFDEVYANFDLLKNTAKRSFPIWVKRDNTQKVGDLLGELTILKDIKLKNWDLVQKNIADFEKRLPKYNKTSYYKGLAAYNQKNYAEAVTQFENFFSRQEQRLIYDPSDVADLIRAYTDSIYETGKTDKFLKVSEAILSDTKNFGTNNAYIQNVRERIAYLGIEIASASAKDSYMLFEKKILDFKKSYPKSAYSGRVSYLLGQAMVTNQKVKEGREIFTGLVNDKETSEYIRDLAKSELSLLNIKDKTL